MDERTAAIDHLKSKIEESNNLVVALHDDVNAADKDKQARNKAN